jgi:hypothetical protein
MVVNYIDDNPLRPPPTGTVVELRQTQTVIHSTSLGLAICGDHSGLGEWPEPRATGITAENAA